MAEAWCVASFIDEIRKKLHRYLQHRYNRIHFNHLKWYVPTGEHFIYVYVPSRLQGRKEMKEGIKNFNFSVHLSFC